MSNYERIKQMSLDEMAEHHFFVIRMSLKDIFKDITYDDAKDMINKYKQWLQSESEE